MPATYERYYEPFLGSGAVFFALKPARATLSDYSSELVATWTAVRDHHAAIEEYLSPLRPDRELYYRIRSNRAKDAAVRAAEFLYLNKTCWNGLYRVNGKGEFNVPYGAPRSDFIFDAENLRACSQILNRPSVSIRRADFQTALRTARKNDLVFLDPPYVTKHNYNGFRDWNEQLFSWSDQERLARTAIRLADKGAHVIVANADHPDVAALYAGFRSATLERASTLASDANRRGRVTEAIFYT